MPINHRIKWTDDELNQLLRETNNKININKIADNHKRTVEAIKFKLFRHSIKLHRPKRKMRQDNLLNVLALFW